MAYQEQYLSTLSNYMDKHGQAATWLFTISPPNNAVFLLNCKIVLAVLGRVEQVHHFKIPRSTPQLEMMTKEPAVRITDAHVHLEKMLARQRTTSVGAALRRPSLALV